MDNPWETGEGSAWWERNRAAVLDPDHAARDHTLMVLERSGLRPNRVLEIGCAGAWRLEVIRKQYGATCFGSDVSAEAIDEGRGRYPHLILNRAASHERQFTIPQDLIVLAFTLHWVERFWLSWTVAQVDSLLMPGSHLIITDFLPDVPTKVRYHHRTDVELWTYKQDYSACFTALGTYRKVDELVFSHATGALGNCDAYNRCAAVLLRKEEVYRE